MASSSQKRKATRSSRSKSPIKRTTKATHRAPSLSPAIHNTRSRSKVAASAEATATASKTTSSSIVSRSRPTITRKDNFVDHNSSQAPQISSASTFQSSLESMTKQELRSLLASHDVLELPPSSARKQALIDLALTHQDKLFAIKQESQSVTKQASPVKATKSSSPEGGEKMGRRRSILSRAPSQQGRRRTSQKTTRQQSRTSSISVSPRQRSLTPHATPFKQQQQSQTMPSTTPATLKPYTLLDSPALQPTGTATGQHGHVLSSLYPLQTRLLAATGYSGTTFASRTTFMSHLLGSLMSLTRILVMFTCILVFGLWLRWKFLYPFPYCDENGGNRGLDERTSLNTFNFSIFSFLSNHCIPCPPHGICRGGQLISCTEGYKPVPNLIFFGSSCKPDHARLAMIEAMSRVTSETLADLAGKDICESGEIGINDEDSMSGRWVGEDELLSIVKKSHGMLKWTDQGLWKASIRELGAHEQTFHVILHRSENLLSMRSTCPRVPLGCRIRLWLLHQFSKHRRLIVTLTLCLFLVSLLCMKWSLESSHNVRVSKLVQSVHDCLLEQRVMNRTDPRIAPSIPVNQLRDALLLTMSLSKKERDRVWKHVSREIENNSNIRESLVASSGEVVWEWIGPIMTGSEEASALPLAIGNVQRQQRPSSMAMVTQEAQQPVTRPTHSQGLYQSLPQSPPPPPAYNNALFYPNAGVAPTSSFLHNHPPPPTSFYSQASPFHPNVFKREGGSGGDKK